MSDLDDEHFSLMVKHCRVQENVEFHVYMIVNVKVLHSEIVQMMHFVMLIDCVELQCAVMEF